MNIQLILMIIFVIAYVKLISDKKSDFLSPINLFVMTLITTYAISCMNLSRLQHEYPFRFTLLIITIVLAFVAGCVIVKHYMKKNEKNFFDYSEIKFKRVIWATFALVVTSFIVTWIVLGAPPLISKINRASYYLSGVGLLYLLIDVLSFLIIYDFFDRKVLGKSFYVILLTVLTMIILMTNKFQIIYFFGQVLILYNVMKKRIKIVTLIKFIFLILIIFITYYTFIYKGLYISNEEMYKVNMMKFPSNMMMLTNPYQYIACNYENLYYYTNLQNVIEGNGYYTLSNFTDSIGITNVLFGETGELHNQWTQNLQYKWLTTGTMFKEFYMDFGFKGIFAGIFIIGIICQLSYINNLEKKRVLDRYIYTSNMLAIMLCFFTNHFITISYIFNILYMICISKYISSKEEMLNENANMEKMIDTVK